jgi:hypothetical protein
LTADDEATKRIADGYEVLGLPTIVAGKRRINGFVRPGCLRNRERDFSVSADPEAGSGMWVVVVDEEKCAREAPLKIRAVLIALASLPLMVACGPTGTESGSAAPPTHALSVVVSGAPPFIEPRSDRLRPDLHRDLARWDLVDGDRDALGGRDVRRLERSLLGLRSLHAEPGRRPGPSSFDSSGSTVS